LIAGRYAAGKGLLCRLLVVVVLRVVAALRVLAVIAQLRQLVVEGLDCGFLLPQDFFDQFVALRFERLPCGRPSFRACAMPALTLGII